MRVRSYEVEEVKFPVTIRGYAEDEVDAFLDRVVETLREYERRDAEGRSEVERLRAALDACREARAAESAAPGLPYEEAEARLRSLLAEAARASERMVEEALEAGEHLLARIRAAAEDAPPRPPPSRPASDPPPLREAAAGPRSFEPRIV